MRKLVLTVLNLFVVFIVVSSFNCELVIAQYATIETQQTPDAVTIAELIAFTSLKNKKGNLLNPPLGSINPEIRETQSFIQGITENLKGPELRNGKKNVVIHIYENTTANAWVQQLNPNTEWGFESKWNKAHPNEVWPLRKLWGFQNNEPIYEVAITTGLLKLIKSKSELAFILGHELTHLLEGHTDSEGSLNGALESWWNKQPHEIVADYLSLQTNLGKYDLDGAIVIMQKLFPKNEWQEKSYASIAGQAIRAGAETHHAEGVRFSILQYSIETLKHTKAYARVVMDESLPLAISKIKGKDRAYYNRQPDAEVLKTFDNTIDKLLTDQDIGIQLTADDKLRSTEDALDDLIVKEANKDYVQFLIYALRRIDKSTATKTQKLNTFLKCMILLGSRATYYLPAGHAFLSVLTQDEITKIDRFLVANSVGKSAWTSQSFFTAIQGEPAAALNFINFAFLSSEIGQSIIKNIKEVSPEWQKYFYELGNIDNFIKNGIVDFTSISHLIDLIDPGKAIIKDFRKEITKKLFNSDNSPEDLRISFRGNLFHSLFAFKNKAFLVKTNDPKEVTKFSWIYGKISSFVYTKDENYEKRLMASKELALALEPYEKIYQAELKANILASLKTADATDWRTMDGFTYLDKLKPSEMNSKDLNKILNLIDGFLKNSILAHKTESVVLEASLNASILEFVPFLIERSENKTKAILDYIEKLICIFKLNSYDNFSTLTQESKMKWITYFQTLTTQDLIYLFSHRTPAEIAGMNAIYDLLKQFPANNEKILREKVLKTKPGRAGYKNIVAKIYAEDYNLKLTDNRATNLIKFLLTFSKREDFGPFKHIELDSLKKILTQLEILNYYSAFLLHRDRERLDSDSGEVLYKAFIQNLDSLTDMQNFITLYSRIKKLVGDSFIGEPNDESLVSKSAAEHLKLLKPNQQIQWLKQESVRKLLDTEFVANTLSSYVVEQVKSHKKNGPEVISQLLKSIPLEKSLPEAYRIFQNSVAEQLEVQPYEILKYFPDDSRSITQKTEANTSFVRGLSTVSTYIRQLSHIEQIEMIEFLMGRTRNVPRAIIGSEADLKIPEFKNIKPFFLKIREELKYRSPIDRSTMINTIFAGPNSILEDTQGLKLITEHILKSIPSENQDFAKAMLEALTTAEADSKSVLFSYILSQKTAKDGEALNQSLILKSFLDAYGAPGVKLAQYLAFTNEFSGFKEVLESYQDAAMPINYFEMIHLIQDQLGIKWDPLRFRVINILGSGSVNITIEYEDLLTHKIEAVSLLRKDIEAKTKEDFLRIQKLTLVLGKNKKMGKDFNFVNGLLKIIEKSVTLEFDKAHSFQIQNSLQSIYRRELNGWNYQTVNAIELMGPGIRMEKAPGKTARKILKTNPVEYKQIMNGFLQMEYEVLMGINETENWFPLPLYANPDIHDGQFLIDLGSKTVTVIDFGQALNISNEEREFAMDLLRIIKGTESIESTKKLVRRYAQDFLGKAIQLDSTKLAKVLIRNDEMDIFVRFISLLQESGFEVPLSSVHWILAANRLAKLGDKIGNTKMKESFEVLIATRKIGLPQTIYNTGHAAKKIFESTFTALGNSLIEARPKFIRCAEIF